MGIWKVRDLYFENKIIPFARLIKRGAKISEYMTWRGLLQSIPDNMKMFNDARDTLDIGLFSCDLSNKYISIDSASEKQLKSALKTIKLKGMQVKDFKSKKRFEAIHGDIEEKDWKNIYSLPRNLKLDNFTKDLQYKTLFRFLATNKLLFQMGKIPSNKCSFCDLHIDTIEHALWECLHVKDFWISIFEIWNKTNTCQYIPNLKLISLGMYETENHSFNIFLLYSKKFIQESKLNSQTLTVHRLTLFLKSKIILRDPNTENIINFIESIDQDYIVPIYE